jgi:hypothetical protein
MKEKLELKNDFEIKKTKYFSDLALKLLSALRPHKDPGGLWDRNAENKRDWGNVSEHCLVEAARIEVLADMLDMPKKLKKDLMTAAALHDFYKKHEIMAFKDAIKKGDSVLSAADSKSEEADEYLRDSGFDENILDIKNSAGGYPETLIRIKDILDKENLSDKDLSMLLMNYIDGYTVNYNWSEPATQEGGKMVNDIDRKIAKIAANPNYEKSESEARDALAGHPFFKGMNSAQGLAAACHQAENKLSQLIKERTGLDVDPIQVPEIVDEEIKRRINLYS